MPVPHDRAACKERHKVDDLFCRIGDYGRIVPRECRASRSYVGLVSLAFALVDLQLCS